MCFGLQQECWTDTGSSACIKPINNSNSMQCSASQRSSAFLAGCPGLHEQAARVLTGPADTAWTSLCCTPCICRDHLHPQCCTRIKYTGRLSISHATTRLAGLSAAISSALPQLQPSGDTRCGLMEVQEGHALLQGMMPRLMLCVKHSAHAAADWKVAGSSSFVPQPLLRQADPTSLPVWIQVDSRPGWLRFWCKAPMAVK